VELEGRFGVGDVWTWRALDADSKLIVCWYVGGRAYEDAAAFIQDLSERVTGRIQLTTDGLGSYPNAVGMAFRQNVDFAQLIKLFANERRGEARYSPPVCTGARVRVDRGNPDPARTSTSYVERQNLTMRMGMRRFTRLTNGCSKKLDNHMAAIAIHFMHLQLRAPAQDSERAAAGRAGDQSNTGDGSRNRRPRLDVAGNRRTSRLGVCGEPSACEGHARKEPRRNRDQEVCVPFHARDRTAGPTSN
jgi:IS1 family transposase